MRVSLVVPPFDLHKEGYGSKRAIKRGFVPPLGLGYIAAELESSGHHVKIIDSLPLRLSADSVLKEISEFGSEAVGVSIMTSSFFSAKKFIKILRENFKGIIFAGGPHITCFPEESIRDLIGVDLLVIGEGEETVGEIFAIIYDRPHWSQVKGIIYIDQGKVIKTQPREYISDLDTIKPPARHLFQNGVYIPFSNQYKRLPVGTMITSRGCPYSCSFCFEAGKFGLRFRQHSVDRVINEIKDMINLYRIREVSFWDDIFGMNKKWMVNFCQALKREKIDITWSCYSRVDLVNKDLLARMAESGCWSIFYGIESSSQELLNTVNKGFTIEQVYRAIKWTHEAGIETRGSFMIALPGETPQIAKKTINFAIELDLTYANFLPTYPEPGTKLYEIAMKEGGFMKYKSRTKAAYVPSGYKDAEEVERMVKKAYRDFYLRPSYFWKLIRKIRSLDDICKYLEGLSFVLGLL